MQRVSHMLLIRHFITLTFRAMRLCMLWDPMTDGHLIAFLYSGTKTTDMTCILSNINNVFLKIPHYGTLILKGRTNLSLFICMSVSMSKCACVWCVCGKCIWEWESNLQKSVLSFALSCANCEQTQVFKHGSKYRYPLNNFPGHMTLNLSSYPVDLLALGIVNVSLEWGWTWIPTSPLSSARKQISHASTRPENHNVFCGVGCFHCSGLHTLCRSH